jgi:hypothetical protein
MRISNYTTQSSQCLIRLHPSRELFFDCFHHRLQRGEVMVVQAKPAGQFPHPFDGIQIGTIRRQVVQRELGFLFRPPVRMQAGMMVLGVIRDDDHASSRATTAPAQFLKKVPRGDGVKTGRLPVEKKLAIAQPNSPEVADTLARGVVQHHRVFHLGRNPQATARTMLLKMDFIDGPQINGGIAGQRAEFFYARL